ncbi:hypothetical protein Acsp06_52950 [Actinomycetospora sp. NBRC 106375]|uniref:hypothetical protein n=1 Tax=Actinomycetospora sp. NBRC 106375 TaxID=3032207 RepID=UPI0024A14E41|nr:hypothetical protein [Actinomycetospora sp. NBRC 106375]GLZ49110.1 hypothetical protein Acsp06_52950 [Actinomycetospora sp. NBRC 106375]
MADEPTKTSTEIAKDLVEKLTEIAEAARGESDDEAGKTKADNSAATAGKSETAKADKPESKSEEEAEDAAISTDSILRSVRERYDSQTKWIVGALVAVGALVFGSLPFTNAVSQPLTLRGFPFGLAWGLVFAALGISVVLWARSRTLEPEDASLGELLRTLAYFAKPSSESRLPIWLRWAGWVWRVHVRPRFGPTVAANKKIYDILDGPEAGAHLGPELDGETPTEKVRELIRKIGYLEGEVFRSSGQVAREDARRAFASVAVSELGAAVKARPSTPEGKVAAADATSLSSWRSSHSQFVDRLRGTEGFSARENLEARRNALGTYLAHRDLLLAESAIAQIRGSFRAGRTLLLLGGLLTLFGAAIYTSSLPADSSSDEKPAAATGPLLQPGTPITVTIASTVGRIDSACRRGGLQGYLLSPSPPPPAADRDGPFTAFIVTPGCSGEITIAEDEGSFTDGWAGPVQPPPPS